MEPQVDRLIANMDGPEAMPRKNGELVFDEPWEARAFGLAIALNDRAFRWDEFRAGLLDELQHQPDAAYYQRWLATLAELLVEKGILSADELEARTAEFRSGLRDEVY